MTRGDEPGEGAASPGLGEGRPRAPAQDPAARAARSSERIRSGLRAVLGGAMMVIGTLHFVQPEPFVTMIPAPLPAPLALVYASGVAEIAGGVGLFVPRLRRAASWGLIALYIAVFPANVNMALNGLPLGDQHVSNFALWARLPLQLVLIAWAWWAGKTEGRTG
jgi:uncharacterized membrane protein